MQVIDRRQFIIMDQPYNREDFKGIVLHSGMILSYHEDLHIQIKEDTLLLGLAFSSETENITLENPLKERFHWSGRWILIHDDKLYLDPCGTLGVFWGYCGDKFVCSSSLNLMKSVLETEWIADYQIQYNDGLPYMDYYPIPFTPYRGIQKMYPTQYLDLLNHSFHSENELWYKQYSECSIEDLFTILCEKLLCIFKNISNMYGENIWIPLTAGVDSRCCVSLAQKAGIRFGTYTAIRDNIDGWDKKAPLLISKKLGIKHFYMNDMAVNNADRERMYDNHCGGKVSVGTDRTQFIANNDVPNAKDSIVLWGTAWELYGRNFWGVLNTCQNNAERLEEWNQYSGEAIYKSNIHTSSLKEWLSYVEENEMATMDWRQRMYYEQRIGSWLSTAYQAIDLFDSDRISPVNCYDIFGILMNLVDKTFPDGERSDKRYQTRIIEDFTPEISDIPYEKNKSYVYRIIRKITRMLKN